MKKITYSAFLIFTLLLAACKGIPIGDLDTKHNETVLVDNHKVECQLYNAANSSLCLQMKIKGDEHWTIIEDSEINGFHYQWGYDYELEVEIENLDPAPEDAPAKKYKWLKQLKKNPASKTDTFEISISGAITSTLIKKVTGEENTYKIYNDKKIECSSEICASIDSHITQDSAILFIFTHHDSPSKPLKVSRVECTSSRENFDADCLSSSGLAGL